MLRDFTSLRRSSGKNEELENMPVNPTDSVLSRTYSEPLRAPLNSIQESAPYSKPDQEVGARSKIDRTPIKAKGKGGETTLPFRTPDKHGARFSAKNRFGWGQRNESGSISDEGKADVGNYSTQMSRVNGSFANVATPQTSRAVGRATSSYSETNSTQSTPTKSVAKPQNSGFRNKLDGNVSARPGNFTALYKGVPFNTGTPTVINTVEVPHFDLKEDSSFWMEHNVQVLIRVRPLNTMERTSYGYNRCLKQESAQCITWIGQPETRFTFDHVACETVDQEMMFRMAGLPMVENCLSGYNSCMFAYGQTGSGKTYTMLGEIEDLEVKPSSYRGMTPRIFEFLFARIQAEEESRSDENLKYNCKCSFLEIYNEQITDLLDPSSSNLLLREDVKKGVYVENLSEFDVQTVNDILKLLKQGSLNRKVAATNMNRESSRSHSVFTCVIESRWEKDSMTNLRFARLNLVDLAGSERQKTSGAEGDRLKEAASINKSLSTLGHVIMVLVDVAQGKLKHVPYRDSRLTFLLQDSLGGNSKTMIIANVSSSICCAAETLNTLKFAQRAKLIQNNAVVNEDSTGDIIALQHQIQLLKEELYILKHQNVSRSLSFGFSTIQDTTQSRKTSCVENMYEIDNQLTSDISGTTSKEFVRMSTEQFKSLETTLAGALRREMMAEASIKQLEAEIEQLNRLVRQREEDTRCTKMMLKFREEKIQRMETHLGGSIPAETYLLEENKALSEEIQLLQAKIDRNPEVTRFARENIRLSDQLRRFQDFYEEGEREVLISEVSKLRDQLLHCLCGNSELHSHSDTIMQPLENAVDELEECKRNLKSCLEENKKLSGEIDNLRSMMSGYGFAQTIPENSVESRKVVEDSLDENMGACEHLVVYPEEEILNLQLELDIVKILLKEQRSSREELEERILCLNRDLELAAEELHIIRKQTEDQNNDLIESKSVIKVLESQQIFSIHEIEELSNNNSHYLQLLSCQESEIHALKKEISMKELRDHSTSDNQTYHAYPFQIKLTRMQDSLEKAKRLNKWYQSDREFHVSSEQEMDEVRRQAEAETAEVIVQMQEELAIVEQQVHDSQLKEVEMKQKLIDLRSELEQMEEKLSLVTKDKERLCAVIEKKDNELKAMHEEWKILTREMEEILSDGCHAFIDATDQLDTISHSFPEKRIWISEQVHKIVRALCEKEFLIDELRRYLEDANNIRCDMESMLKSLRGAAMVIGEAHQQECSEKDKEILQLTSQLKAKASCIRKLESKIKLAEDHIERASVCSTAAFVIVNRFVDLKHSNDDALKHMDMDLNKLIEMNLKKDIICDHQACIIKETEKKMESLNDQLAEMERNCSQLERSLFEERERALLMELKVQDIENSNILMTKEKLAKFESGVFTLKSSMASYMQQDGGLEENNSQEYKNVEQADSEAQSENDIELDNVKHTRTRMIDSPKKGESVKSYSYSEKNDKGSSNVYDKEKTILLLKKEIESALESLQEVQAEMTKAHVEKKAMLVNEKQSQEKMRYLASQAMSLQSTMNNFERNSGIKIDALNNRLRQLEHTLEGTSFHWSEVKEVVELEVGDEKILAAHKTAEASCILAKFEEAQNAIIEADMMINGLIIANETLKVEVERLNEERIVLINDHNTLRQEVHSLQCSNDLLGQQIQSIEQQASSNVEDTKALIMELANVIKKVKFNISENFASLAYDLQSTKSLLNGTMKLMHSWLENIWFEIISKDCAVSVLHLCHLGILVETLTGLNAEKSLLQYGMCQSNAIVAELSEHNVKSKRELDMCRALKGKLLADFKKSFDRIQRKEDEAGQLNMKLIHFEKKISDLQFQEELMLQRSNNMGSQLAVLMKELNLFNTDALNSLLIHEKRLKNKEELESQNEFFMKEWCLKDFELHIVLAELDVTTIEKADMDRENMVYQAIIETLKEDLVLSKVDTELREKLVEENKLEVLLLQGELQKALVEKKNLLSKLELSSLRLTEMHALNRALEQEIQSLKDEVCSNDGLRVELNEVTEMKVRLLNQVELLEAEYRNLQKDKETKEEDLQREIWMLENATNKLQSLLDAKDAELDRENMVYQAIIETLKEDLVLTKVDTELREKLVEENKLEVFLLQGELQNALVEKQNLLSKLELSSLRFTEMHALNRALDQEIQSLKDEVCSNDGLRVELNEVTEMKVRLSNQVELLEAEYRNLQKDKETKEEDLQREIWMLENATDKLQSLLDAKDAELCELSCLEKEQESLKGELIDLETQNTVLLQNLETNKSDTESSLARVHACDRENQKLRDEVSSLQTCISELERDLEINSAELLELQSSQSAIMASVSSANRLKEENDCLKNEVESYKKSHQEFLKNSSLNIMKSFDSVEMKSCCGIEKYGTTILDKIFQEMFENVDRLSRFIVEFQGLELHAEEVIHENLTLQAELLRKDEVLKGLLFDLSLLQETASNNKDKKDEFDKIVASMEALDHELAVKLTQLDEAISHNHTLEVELGEKKDEVTALQLDISNERESVEFLSYQIADLRANINNALEEKNVVEQELSDRKKIIEDMEIELLEMRNALSQMNNLVESMASSLNQVGNERDTFQVEMLCLKEQLETTEAQAAKFEANLMEEQQTSESRKIYAEEKIAEVKLLERSVEELECTINVLENKVDIIKEEAERQRLQREELELELHSVNYKMQNFEDANTNMKRELDEKERKLQETLKRYTIVELDIAEKNSEIGKLKAHISELNLHAESQANEYKQKYKALESMAEQVRAEGHSTNVANSLPNKSEKHPLKPRGSGSPFKCIGLGLTQQMKSEKDEELTAARLHIEELESLAINRQKEIFTLNSRLAAAESMTHDVIRDLLGLKLDMTSCASLVDNQQVQKIAERVRLNDLEYEEKEQDVVKLKKQINDFIEERRGWLEEIDRKQTEMISVQVALEKLKQRDQLLKTENEMLKIETINCKKRMTELEEQVKKLSGQQNLQQRIHHHAKIKEENNLLRLKIEDLTAELHHTEVHFSRAKEELSRFRATFEEEQHALNFNVKIPNERIRQSQPMPQPSPANSRTDDHLRSPKLDNSRAPYFSVLDR